MSCCRDGTNSFLFISPLPPRPTPSVYRYTPGPSDPVPARPRAACSRPCAHSAPPTHPGAFARGLLPPLCTLRPAAAPHTPHPTPTPYHGAFAGGLPLCISSHFEGRYARKRPFSLLSSHYLGRYEHPALPPHPIPYHGAFAGGLSRPRPGAFAGGLPHKPSASLRPSHR